MHFKDKGSSLHLETLGRSCYKQAGLILAAQDAWAHLDNILAGLVLLEAGIRAGLRAKQWGCRTPSHCWFHLLHFEDLQTGLETICSLYERLAFSRAVRGISIIKYCSELHTRANLQYKTEKEVISIH